MLFTLSNGLKVVVITHRETSCKGERTILLIDHIFSVGTDQFYRFGCANRKYLND